MGIDRVFAENDAEARWLKQPGVRKSFPWKRAGRKSSP
jgi:hypothetical protein